MKEVLWGNEMKQRFYVYFCLPLWRHLWVYRMIQKWKLLVILAPFLLPNLPPPCRKLPNFPVWALSFLYWNPSQAQPLFVALATPPPQQPPAGLTTGSRRCLHLKASPPPSRPDWRTPLLFVLFTKAAPPSSQYSHRLTSPKTSSLSQNREGSGKMSSSEFPVTGWHKCKILHKVS